MNEINYAYFKGFKASPDDHRDGELILNSGKLILKGISGDTCT